MVVNLDSHLMSINMLYIFTELDDSLWLARTFTWTEIRAVSIDPIDVDYNIVCRPGDRSNWSSDLVVIIQKDTLDSFHGTQDGQQARPIEKRIEELEIF